MLRLKNTKQTTELSYMDSEIRRLKDALEAAAQQGGREADIRMRDELLAQKDEQLGTVRQQLEATAAELAQLQVVHTQV